MELNDLVKVYDNVLDHDTCKSWIEYFESSDKKQKEYDGGRPNWYYLYADQHTEDMEKAVKIYQEIYFKDIVKHFEHLTGYNYYPYIQGVKCYLERWKIKRYNPGLDEKFDSHVDNINCWTSERFLSFIFYLNDVKEGGETCFEHRKIKPKE